MLSAGLLIASLLYWGSNSDAPAKTMISPAKISGGRQRKRQQLPMPPSDFFGTPNRRNYPHSSPNHHQYPCSLFCGSVTTATGQSRQECLAHKEIAQGSTFHGIRSYMTLHVFTKPVSDFFRTGRGCCTAVWLTARSQNHFSQQFVCLWQQHNARTEGGGREGNISIQFSVQSALKIHPKNVLSLIRKAVP